MGHTSGKKSLSFWNYAMSYRFKNLLTWQFRKFLVRCLLKLCSIILLHFLVRIHSIWIRHCGLGKNFGFLHVLMLMTMISTGMVVTKSYSCAYVGNFCPKLDLVLLLSWLASVFLNNSKLYCWLLIQCRLLNLCFLVIILLRWWHVCLLLWFWGVLTGSATLI